ncbi:MAG: TetR/AcrR family transcriptional regulator [Bacteroidetes bacterium]|nr:TetR/AcrR family transcriptional regulator [Bacteroidota bacterium]
MNTKTKILEAARELFMRYGVRSVTMDDIARELGVSKKTLYQVVSNKAELIDGVVDQFLAGEELAIAFIQSKAEDAISEMLLITQHVTQVLRQLKPATVYDLQKYYREAWNRVEAHHQDHVYQVVKDNVETGIKEGLYRSDLDSDFIARLYVSKSFILVDEEVFPLREFDRDKLLREFFDYHIHGIASPKGLEVLEKYKKQKQAPEA